MYKFIRDEFFTNRGGVPKILEILCDHCKSHVAFYQKDASGTLKRMYIDRIIDLNVSSKSLACLTCNRELGVK